MVKVTSCANIINIPPYIALEFAGYSKFLSRNIQTRYNLPLFSSIYSNLRVTNHEPFIFNDTPYACEQISWYRISGES